MPKAIISSVATYLPAKTVDNEELSRRWDTWSAEQIYQKTGIRKRHIAAKNECASDLAAEAAKILFARGQLNPQDVDYLLFCTQSPDYFLPASACLIQERLGLPRTCGALDFNQGCSGYVMGLSLAKGLIESGQARCVLLLTGETYSKYIHPNDRSICTVFGDAGAATAIRSHGGSAGLGDFVFGTDGRGGANLIVPSGAMREPRTLESSQETIDADGNIRSRDNLYMNGREIFRFAIQEVPKTIQSLLGKANLSISDLEFLILHQANRFMLDELVRKIRLPMEKCPYEFEDVGNTVSCTIPIVLERLLAGNRISSGNRLLLIGFGVGYSWAGGVVEWQ